MNTLFVSEMSLEIPLGIDWQGRGLLGVASSKDELGWRVRRPAGKESPDRIWAVIRGAKNLWGKHSLPN